jgi:ABC-type Fe3+ transport system permease subunit
MKSIYLYVCICWYMCIYAYIYINIHLYIHYIQLLICICTYLYIYIYRYINVNVHTSNHKWQLFLQKRQRWFMDVYIHTYIGIIIIIIIYKHIIIHISFIYNTIPLNVLYSSSNSSSFWTKFEQSLNKFVSILVVIYIISKQQYKRIYNRKEDNL